MRAEVKWVVFDLGKVLLEFDFAIAAKAMAAYSPLDPCKIQQAIDQSALLHQFERGLLTETQFFSQLSQVCQIKASEETLRDAFIDIFTPVPSMIGFLTKLKARRMPMLLFSNTNISAMCHIRKQFEFIQLFDQCCLSYEHGMMKPEQALYDIARQMTGVNHASLLFIDDRKENIEAARQKGWLGIVHESPQATIPEVERWLNQAI